MGAQYICGPKKPILFNPFIENINVTYVSEECYFLSIYGNIQKTKIGFYYFSFGKKKSRNLNNLQIKKLSVKEEVKTLFDFRRMIYGSAF